jgi:hypothetical protein
VLIRLTVAQAQAASNACDLIRDSLEAAQASLSIKSGRGKARTMATRKPKQSKTKAVDPDRAVAAAEVLAAVWLSEKNFELDTKVSDPPTAKQDAEEHVWITVKIHVPALDIDMWIDGTHSDHPDNASEDE